MTLAPSAAARSQERTGTLVVFLATLTVYVKTLAPTVYNLDSAELTTAAHTGGILRATGYPLYLLLGRLWSQLPVGDVGYRMNLFSAVCGALTIALGYHLLGRLGIGVWARLGALGLLATSYYFWAMSLVAEVYTLHTAFVVLILLALLAYADHPRPPRLALATLLVGLAFGNQVATVLLAPGCLLFVLWISGRRALAPRSLLWAAGGLCAGLSVYLYLPLLYLREPAINSAGRFDAAGNFVAVDLTTFDGIWWLVSGRAFADRMLAWHDGQLAVEMLRFGEELWRAFLGIAIGVGLLGLVVCLRRRPPFGAATLAMFSLTSAFYVTYAVLDKATMFLPSYVFWAIWVAFGYQWLESLLHESPHQARPHAKASVAALRLVAIGAVAFSLFWNGRLVDLSRDWSARQRGEEILRRLPPDALLVGWWNTVPVVDYLQLVEGRRPDVRALNRFLIREEDLSVLVLSEIRRRPVYSDAPLTSLLPQLRALPAGNIYRLVERTPSGDPEPASEDEEARP